MEELVLSYQVGPRVTLWSGAWQHVFSLTGSSHWPLFYNRRAHYVAQASFELGVPPLTSQELALQACTITPS